MFRIFKEQIERVIVALIHLSRTEASPEGRNQVVTNLKAYRPDNLTAQDVVYRVMQRYNNPSMEDVATESVVVDMISQLGRKKSDDLDLIDTIVNTLQLHYGVNHFHASYLKSLRSAILRPEELIKCKKSSDKSLDCATCGKQLSNGQVMTATLAGDGSMKFECTNCRTPTVATCRICGEMMIMKSSYNVQKGAECGCRQRATEQAPTEVQFANGATITFGRTAGPEAPAVVPALTNAAARRAAARQALRDAYIAAGVQPGETENEVMIREVMEFNGQT